MSATTSVWRRIDNQRGFSLAELLLAVAVMGIVITGVFTLQRQGQEAYLLGSNRVETQQNARVAVDLITRELRSAASLTAINANAGNPDITFVDQTGATIRYCWSSSTTGCVSSGTRSTLVRLFNGAPTVLIGGVPSMTITYYDQSLAVYTLTDATKVWAIRLRITAKTEEGSATGMPGNQRATMESTVQLRAKVS